MLQRIPHVASAPPTLPHEALAHLHTPIAPPTCRLPFERSHNSDNLKLLNQYVDQLATGANPAPISVSFWTRGDLQLELTDAMLDGSLGSLYLAFGLITSDEWAELRAANPTGVTADDTNLLQWLDETVRDAVATADEHEQRKKLVRELKATIEFRFGLNAVRVGNTYSSTSVDLARQLECLRVFEAFLTEQASTEAYEGLTFELYHPWSAPSQTYAWVDGGAAERMQAAAMKAHISADGCMHLIADRATIRGQIESLDRQHARVLGGVNGFWARRQRDLVPQLRAALAVQNVWCDNRSAESQEAFVLWAGRILNARSAFADALVDRTFSFSVLVHSDPASPLIDYMATSSVLQARAALRQLQQSALCAAGACTTGSPGSAPPRLFDTHFCEALLRRLSPRDVLPCRACMSDQGRTDAGALRLRAADSARVPDERHRRRGGLHRHEPLQPRGRGVVPAGRGAPRLLQFPCTGPRASCNHTVRLSNLLDSTRSGRVVAGSSGALMGRRRRACR